MAHKPLKLTLAVAVGLTSLWVQASHAQQGGMRLPPPPPSGSGTSGTNLSGSNTLPPPPPPPLPPIGSGSNGSVTSGTNTPPPPPPPMPPVGSGSNGSVTSGTNTPPPPPPPLLPPIGSGSNGSVTSGTNTPPPPPPPPVGSGTDAPPVLTGSGGLQPPPPPPSGSDSPQLPPLLPMGSIETLTEQVVFSPVGSGSATIKALFVAINTSGTYQGSLNLACGGLTSGTYTLTATMTDESTVTLGTFSVPAKPAGKPSKSTQKVGFGGKGGIPFPPDVNPMDIAALTISDANANALYEVDLTAISDGNWMAHIALTAGEGAPGALGFADVNAKARQGTVTGCLGIHAKGLPANTTYTYSLDGTDIGTVTTGSDGSLRFKVTSANLPAAVDLFSVKALVVHDDSNVAIVSADF